MTKPQFIKNRLYEKIEGESFEKEEPVTETKAEEPTKKTYTFSPTYNTEAADAQAKDAQAADDLLDGLVPIDNTDDKTNHIKVEIEKASYGIIEFSSNITLNINDKDFDSNADYITIQKQGKKDIEAGKQYLLQLNDKGDTSKILIYGPNPSNKNKEERHATNEELPRDYLQALTEYQNTRGGQIGTKK